MKGVRAEAVALVKDVSGDSTYNDVNYVFPTYIVTQLPVGLVGLLMAAIFAAAMSTIAGELSALSTSTVIDFYRRWVRDDGDETHLLWVSKVAMLFWAVFASIVAIWAAELGSLIEVVNRFGSFFYGSILGVFLLAIGWKRANSTGAFVGLIAGMSVVGYVAVNTNDRVPLAQPDRRRRGVRRRHDRQRADREHGIRDQGTQGIRANGTPAPRASARCDRC